MGNDFAKVFGSLKFDFKPPVKVKALRTCPDFFKQRVIVVRVCNRTVFALSVISEVFKICK